MSPPQISEMDLKKILRDSTLADLHDRLTIVESSVSSLRSDSLALKTEMAHQTSMLQAIDSNTQGLVGAWKSAEGTWNFVQMLSKIAKIVIPILAALAIFISGILQSSWSKILKLLT